MQRGALGGDGMKRQRHPGRDRERLSRLSIGVIEVICANTMADAVTAQSKAAKPVGKECSPSDESGRRNKWIFAAICSPHRRAGPQDHARPVGTRLLGLLHDAGVARPLW